VNATEDSVGRETARAAALAEKTALKGRIDSAEQLLLFLDFDGTLAPIVKRPAVAKLPAQTRSVLKKLKGLPRVVVAIVSGRSLQDLKPRIGVDGVAYAGNHGFEIEAPGLQFEHPQALRLRDALVELSAQIASRAACLEGVEVEHKGFTTSVHFRRASRSTSGRLAAVMREVVAANDKRFVIQDGRKVYEIRPRIDWNKGHAVRLLRIHLGLAAGIPVVIGDDATDEDAFAAFHDAITICVNPRQQSAARYSLADPDEVHEFLDWIARTWQKSGESTRGRRAVFWGFAHGRLFSRRNQ
jgi:trehalose-phosphatase